MSSPRSYEWYRTQYTDKSTTVTLLAADSGKADVITPKTSSHQLFIQRIIYNPTVVAAQAVTIEDGADVEVGLVPASQATPIVFDFGPQGRALTVGEELDIENTAGPGAVIAIEAYEKLGAAISYLSGASSQ